MPRRFRAHGAAAISLALSVLVLSGCAPRSVEPTTAPSTSAAASCEGVRVLVDYGPLNAAPVDTCVPSSAQRSAIDIVQAAGLTVEGTAAYGTAVVCRLNGQPAASESIQTKAGVITESCAKMPAADAYWSVWVRSNGSWAYAEVGFSDITLKPGDGLALTFNVDNSAATPNG